MESKLPRRKQNRLKHYDYSSVGAYFLTICSKERQNIFGKIEVSATVGEDIILPQDLVKLTPVGEIVKTSILSIPLHYSHVKLLHFVIMPNHIHLLLHIEACDGRIISSPTIQTIVGQMKRYASKCAGEDIWQKSFHDHVVRNPHDYDRIAKYIYENPLRWQTDCFFAE